MTRSLSLALLLAVGVVAGTTAQVPAPAPTPSLDPHEYSDAAMHFTAPSDYELIGRRQIPLDDLEQQTAVAVWAKFKGKEDQRTIVITLEPYDGRDLAGYEQNVENTLRGQVDGLIVDHKVRESTPNGMPVYFLTITSGEGFSSQRRYEYVWPDGQRGVQLSIGGRLGELTEQEARAALHDIYAVLYPSGRL